MISSLDGTPLTHQRVALTTTGVTGPLHLHVVTAGPDDGTPVILLHGFPDFWYGWREMIPALAQAGYRVIVPDQRGIASSDRPPGIRPYKTDHLADDVRALQDALCGGAATHLIGHDWGGGVAWAFAARHPTRLRTLTVINCPPADVLKWSPLRDPIQLLRSIYIPLFLLPWIPIEVLHRVGVESLLNRWGGDFTFTETDLEQYATLSDRQSLRAAIAWYRAAAVWTPPRAIVDAPTLVLWGPEDPALGLSLAEQSVQRCTDGRLVWLDGAAHFSHLEAPDRAHAAILEHLGQHGGTDPHVYKIVDAATWADAPDPWPGSADDLRDGFVHFSASGQVAGTLAKHFADREDLLLLTVGPDRLPAGSLRWEPSRGGQRFPHGYAGLPRDAIVAQARLVLDDDGVHRVDDSRPGGPTG